MSTPPPPILRWPRIYSKSMRRVFAIMFPARPATADDASAISGLEDNTGSLKRFGRSRSNISLSSLRTVSPVLPSTGPNSIAESPAREVVALQEVMNAAPAPAVHNTFTSDSLERFASFGALHDASAQDPDRTCIPGTREHVLERIQRWIDNRSAERSSWLHGPAGAGKSAIARKVDDANTRDKVAATFFFSRSDPSRNDWHRLFTTLAWQLALSIPAIENYIVHSLTERPNLPTADVETQFEELIVRPFLALNENTSAVRHQAPVVIIDGIDECLDEKLQQRILEVIGTAIRNTDFPLRFLISSRSEAHIEETVNRFKPHILYIDLATIHDTDNDVEHYLRAEFSRIAGERGLDPTWPGQQILQHLVFKSAGQFLYAADVIRLIGDADNIAITQLDIMLGLKPPQAIPPLAVLDQAYLEILGRVQDQDFLKAFLGLLVGRCSFSKESDDDELLLAVSRIDLGRRLCRMRSILKFEPYIDPHYPSFIEFLQDPSRSGQYHVSKSAGIRLYLALMTNLFLGRAAMLTEQPDFHGTDHFTPQFGKLINDKPQVIELMIEDWEQILRPLLNVLNKLLVPSNIDSLKAGYCQQCRFFQSTFDTLTYFKSLGEGENSEVERSLNSLGEIIGYCDPDRGRQNFDMNFGRHIFGSAAIVGIVMAILAHNR